MKFVVRVEERGQKCERGGMYPRKIKNMHVSTAPKSHPGNGTVRMRRKGWRKSR